MGHNVSFVKNGFFDQIQTLRNEGGDKKIDEAAIVDFNLKRTTSEILNLWASTNSLRTTEI